MRVLLIIAWCVLLGQLPRACAADEPKEAKKPMRHVEKAGGFSFVPPAGWTFRKVAGQKFSVGVGPPLDKGWVPQIDFVVHPYKATLPVFVAGQKKFMATGYKNFKLLGEKNLKTESGAKGIAVLFLGETNGQKLRHYHCYFDLSPSKKTWIMCAVPVTNGDKLDAAFEASFKTWRLEKP